MGWRSLEIEQKEICEKYNLEWNSVDLNSMIAVNKSLFTNVLPINGLRYPKEGNTEGWYIWSGGEIPQDKIDFFQQIHLYHLVDRRPEVLKYLGLPVGSRFQIDTEGFEDIWFNEKVANI